MPSVWSTADRSPQASLVTHPVNDSALVVMHRVTGGAEMLLEWLGRGILRGLGRLFWLGIAVFVIIAALRLAL